MQGHIQAAQAEGDEGKNRGYSLSVIKELEDCEPKIIKQTIF